MHYELVDTKIITTEVFLNLFFFFLPVTKEENGRSSKTLHQTADKYSLEIAGEQSAPLSNWRASYSLERDWWSTKQS